MYIIIYYKTTKKIAFYRHDTSMQPLPAQNWFDIFLVDNDVSGEDYSFVELPFTKALNSISIGNHVYNESTQQVEADPSYVRPTDAELLAPTPVEPAE
jgi:hypothetical protein